MGKGLNLVGKRFGNLTVIQLEGRDKGRNFIWLCKCDCGNYYKATSRNLTSGITTNCGCLTGEKISKSNTLHGMSRTRLYKIWVNMKTRCKNPNTPKYYNYGGRGIDCCEEWEDFENFMEWSLKNGYSDDLTLDRIDINGNYSPKNCRWITNQEQQNNKRDNHYITFNGRTQTIAEWALELGIKPTTLYSRIDDYHWDEVKALTTPVKRRE